MNRDIKDGFVASVASVAWTSVTSAIAVGFGLRAGSVVLVAFGAVGLFDMAGSLALVAHFRHALRHEAISGRHERVAHLVVAYGMLTVGVATLVASSIRLAAGASPDDSVVGLVTSATSIVVLGYLGVSKRRIGGRIPSHALTTDGWLSLTGCGTAACAVAGLALNEAFGWGWVDSAAAIGIGATAVAIAVASLRG